MNRRDELRERLSETESELGAVRYELARLLSRRPVRVALLLAEALRRPHRLLTTLRHLPAVLRGGMPVRDPIPHPATVRPYPHPHLTVVDRSGSSPYVRVAPHVGPDQRGDGEVDDPPEDLHLVDLRGGAPADVGPADVDAPTVVLIDAVEQVDHPSVAGADLVVTEEDQLAEEARRAVGDRLLELAPSVDVHGHNPVGWQREPAGGVLHLLPTTDPTRLTDHRVAVADPDAFASGAAFAGAVLVAVAHGTPVVLPPGAALPPVLDGVVTPTEEEVGLQREVELLTGDPDARERRSVAARRVVLGEHSRRRRFERILEHLDIPVRAPELVTVMLATNRPGQVPFAIEQVRSQEHPRVELVLVLHGDGFDEVEVDRLTGDLPTRVIRAPERWMLGDCYNAALDVAAGTLLAKMDDDDHYGPLHLSDLVLAREYTGADVVGRTSNFVHLSSVDRTVAIDVERQERWDPHHLPGPAMLWDAEIARRARFRRVPRAIDTHALRDAYRVGARVYTTHRYQLVRARHGAHTYEEEDRRFLRRAGDQVWEGLRTDIAFT